VAPPDTEHDISPTHGQKKRAAKNEPTSPGPRTRRSREETTAAILDAAAELFSRRDPRTVTVREIAERADVTHPLVHQYVGSKKDILEAVILRGIPQRQRMMTEHPDLREAVPLLVADVLGRRVHSRTVLRSAMDGGEFANFPDRLDAGRRLLGLARESARAGSPRPPAPGATDPRIVMASMVALAYGWVGAQDWLTNVFELEGEDSEELKRQIGEVCLYVADLVFPLAENPGSD
jgi:AcrR family transcriptional regulator